MKLAMLNIEKGLIFKICFGQLALQALWYALIPWQVLVSSRIRLACIEIVSTVGHFLRLYVENWRVLFVEEFWFPIGLLTCGQSGGVQRVMGAVADWILEDAPTPVT